MFRYLFVGLALLMSSHAFTKPNLAVTDYGLNYILLGQVFDDEGKYIITTFLETSNVTKNNHLRLTHMLLDFKRIDGTKNPKEINYSIMGAVIDCKNLTVASNTHQIVYNDGSTSKAQLSKHLEWIPMHEAITIAYRGIDCS